MSSPITRPRARLRLRATARSSWWPTMIPPVPSSLLASPTLRIARSSLSSCLSPRSRPRLSPSCVSCRSPACSRCCCGLSRFWPPLWHWPMPPISSPTVLCFPTRLARCATSPLLPPCWVSWITSPPIRAKTSSPTTFRSIPILASRSVAPRKWRARRPSMPRPSSKTTTATPLNMRNLPTTRTSLASRWRLSTHPSRTRLLMDRSMVLRVPLPTRR